MTILTYIRTKSRSVEIEDESQEGVWRKGYIFRGFESGYGVIEEVGENDESIGRLHSTDSCEEFTEGSTMTLGEKLKAANEARAREKSQAEVRKRESDALKYNADTATILAFLEGCKERFIEAIESGVTPKRYKIPAGKPYDTYSWKGQDSKGKFHVINHPHYNAFQSFFDWATENGLIGYFTYCHDGGGMDSWYEVDIKPKD